MEGFLIIDKPVGITSHDVVDRVRRVTRMRRVGHAGTLDPFASGVLIIGIGPATRLLSNTHKFPKTYEMTVCLGATSDTDDRTGLVTMHPTALMAEASPTQHSVERALAYFEGNIEQIPPMYAAIKLRGKKLYEYARRGEQIERKPRQVTIHAIELLAYHYPHLAIRVQCGSGTYMRALARDIGDYLGIGGYAEALRRTAIGPWTHDDAIPLDKISSDTIASHVRPALE